jgi:hypothetical protein
MNMNLPHCPVCHNQLYKTTFYQSKPELIIICTSCAFVFSITIDINEDIAFRRAITCIKEFKQINDFLSIPCPKHKSFLTLPIKQLDGNLLRLPEILPTYEELSLRVVYRELLNVFIGQAYCISNCCRFYTDQEYGVDLPDLITKLKANIPIKITKPEKTDQEYNGNWAENDFI